MRTVDRNEEYLDQDARFRAASTEKGFGDVVAGLIEVTAGLAHRPRMRQVVGTDLEHLQPLDLRRFLKQADGDPLAPAWRMTCAGMTRADVLGLRWSDIRVESGVVTISQGRIALDAWITPTTPRAGHADGLSASRRCRQARCPHCGHCRHASQLTGSG
jgi:integrase